MPIEHRSEHPDAMVAVDAAEARFCPQLRGGVSTRGHRPEPLVRRSATLRRLS